MTAYAGALRRHVNSDSVVVDLGTGTGIFVLLACKAGARRVYAIENADVIQVAKEIVAANGYSRQVEFIQNVSTEVTLPEKASVIISDIRGILPLFQNHLPAIIDSRQRMLLPDGVLIPARDSLWAALAEAHELYETTVGCWSQENWGYEMDAARTIEVNSIWKSRLSQEQLLVKPTCFAELNYATIEEVELSAELSWTVTKTGTAHGICVWFDAMIAEDFSFSNAPGAPELVYGQSFFPLAAPVHVSTGDIISCSLRARLIEDDYIWSWKTKVFHNDNLKASFEQTTFRSLLISPEQLRKRADSYKPELNDAGEVDRFILSLINGGATIGDIAASVTERFPNQFSGWSEAVGRVGELSAKYSR